MEGILLPNCRNKDACPLDGKCLATETVYKAEVSGPETPKTYIGLTEPPFNTRYSNHLQSFRHEKYAHSTELSKHIWDLKRHDVPHDIRWSIAKRARAYNNETKRCDLCLTEKLYIMKADRQSRLNKRPELVSKCRHENKYYLSNFKEEFT